MGNWPSVDSESSTSLSSFVTDAEDSDHTRREEEEDEGTGNLYGSEKSFFSEEEVLPLEAVACSNDEIDARKGLICDENDLTESRNRGLPSTTGDDHTKLEKCSATRQDTCAVDDSEDEEEGEDDLEEEEDAEEHVEYDGRDEIDEIFLPSPSLNERMHWTSSMAAAVAEEAQNIHIPPEGSITAQNDKGVHLQRSPRAENRAEDERHPVVAWEIDVGELTGTRKPTRKGMPKKFSKLTDKRSKEKSYVPPVVSTTPELLAQRKWLDQQRWFCMSRPQYSKSCGLSSVVSCWNYLFSSLGGGTMSPITQEEALMVLGFQPPFGEIRFGPFTGNATLMRWFKQLNDHYGVRGRAYYQYKPHGRGKTLGRTSAEGQHLLKQGLRDPNMAFIYHCYNHYFCPIGYEDVPQKAVDAYRDPLSQDEVQTWILVGDPSRKHPGIHCFRWDDISTDLNCQNPEYLNIRKLNLGVQCRKTKRTGGNLHCIMAFCRSAGFLTRENRGKERHGVRAKKKDTIQTIESTSSLHCSQESEMGCGEREGFGESQVSQQCTELEWGAYGRETIGSDPEKRGKDIAKKKGGLRTKKTKKQKSTAGEIPVKPLGNPRENRVNLRFKEDGTERVEGESCSLVNEAASTEKESNGQGVDEVTRFIQGVSSRFTQSLDSRDRSQARMIKEAMLRSELSSSYSSTGEKRDSWLLDGVQPPGQHPLEHVAMDKQMRLSDPRAVDPDTYRQVTADGPRNSCEEQDGVSQLARCLIDQYLSSILDSVATQKE